MEVRAHSPFILETSQSYVTFRNQSKMKRLSVLNAVSVVLQLRSAGALVVSDRAQMAKGRLIDAFKSPAGKLTLSPEVLIPEPSDPTAILLQSSLITSLSAKMRTHAKANAVFCSGSITALKTFCNEQEIARGNFPSPLPLIYCDKTDDLLAVVDAGATGIVVAVCDGKEISSPDDLASDTTWSATCQEALEKGLQPIPEITIGQATAENWQGGEVEAIIAKIAEMVGEDPASVLISVNVPPSIESDNDEATSELETTEEPEIPLPKVSKSVSKRVPILGSIRSKAGGGRMGEEAARFKACGFTGAVLRQDCIPQISMSQDLEYLSTFWSACIGDLKSTKSKAFEFRSKNNMNKDLGVQWAKYQMDVMQSGALGAEESHSAMGGLNTEAGDYKGF
jgi:hypothetical protein